MRPLLVSLCLLSLLSSVAAAETPAETPDPASDRERRYAACMDLVRSKPERAWDEAEQWLGLDGAEQARHCGAAALMALGRYRDAAVRFESLAQEAKTEPHVKAGLLDQAGQAWLMAGDGQRAAANLRSAVKLEDRDADLWVDLGQALADTRDYAGAVTALDSALRLHPLHPDALVLRATALRYLERMDEARSMLEMALDFYPSNVDALLERGIVRRLAGDSVGARADWLWVVNLEPDSVAAEAARANLARMDVKAPEPPPPPPPSLPPSSSDSPGQ